MRNFTRRVLLQLGRLGLFLYRTSIESRNALTNIYMYDSLIVYLQF